MKQAKRHARGFTLIELLVVLVILGLLAALAGPRVMKYLGGAKSDTAKTPSGRVELGAGSLPPGSRPLPDLRRRVCKPWFRRRAALRAGMALT
jgi:prepilin-type N-terminal cleavage/methylation domain-containing protein